MNRLCWTCLVILLQICTFVLSQTDPPTIPDVEISLPPDLSGGSDNDDPFCIPVRECEPVMFAIRLIKARQLPAGIDENELRTRLRSLR